MLIIIAVIAVFLVLSVFPMKSGYGTFIVLSGSMEPEIHTGSVVAVKTQDEYKIGDVITFGENTKSKKPTTHRITEVNDSKEGNIYTTKGDANNSEDQKTVKEDEILGRVFFSIPYIGYAVSAVQKPIGFILILVIPAVIIIYDEIGKIKKEVLKKVDYRKRMKKRKEEKEASSSASASVEASSFAKKATADKPADKGKEDDNNKETDEKKEV